MDMIEHRSEREIKIEVVAVRAPKESFLVVNCFFVTFSSTKGEVVYQCCLNHMTTKRTFISL